MKALSGKLIALRTKEQLADLTGLQPGTVSSLTKTDQNWRVVVDMVELKCIPDTKDILGSYEALVDDDGNLVQYQRVRRYCREDVTEND
jgi:hypothetical protein